MARNAKTRTADHPDYDITTVIWSSPFATYGLVIGGIKTSDSDD